jgi:phage gpG-like protein
MITFKFVNDENVILNLRSMGIRVRDNLREAVTRAAIMLTRYVKEEKLSGQALKNRTGTLRRKINYVVAETPAGITGSVGVDLSYAAAHEYGFDGTVSVREHLRTVKQAFGRPISPVTSIVSAYQRHMHLPERSFLRSALRDQAIPIGLMLRQAVAEATI